MAIMLIAYATTDKTSGVNKDEISIIKFNPKKQHATSALHVEF